MSGYTKSYREKWQHPVFRDLLEAGIWAWMCDTAAWKDTKIRFNGELVSLRRGQLVTSVRFISDGFRIGEQVTRTFLENLKNEGMANAQPTHRGTIITICNYDKYQEKENADNTLTNEQLTSSQQAANTNKKELKKKRNKEINICNKPDDVTEDVWADFVTHRKAKKAPITETALAGIRSESTKAGWQMGAALAECCARGWIGFKAEWVAQKHEQSPSKPTVDGARQAYEWHKKLLAKGEAGMGYNVEPEYRLREKIAEYEAKHER